MGVLSSGGSSSSGSSNGRAVVQVVRYPNMMVILVCIFRCWDNEIDLVVFIRVLIVLAQGQGNQNEGSGSRPGLILLLWWWRRAVDPEEEIIAKMSAPILISFCFVYTSVHVCA